MLLCRSARFVWPMLCFAACQAPSSPVTVPPWVADQELRNEVVALRALVTQQLQRAKPTPARHLESAGLLECNARIGTLTDRVEDLTQLLAASGRSNGHGKGVVDATGKRAAAGSAQVAASTTARIEMLQAGLQLAMQQCEVHVENIANCNVPGYQRRTLQMTTKLHEETGLRVPVAASAALLATSGALEVTERTLDVAIDGAGYFVVAGDEGRLLFTRSGNLHLDASGRLVTSTGRLLVPVVRVPSDTLDLSIDSHGQVLGRRACHPDSNTSFGWIETARFPNPGALEPATGNLLRPTPAAGAAEIGRPDSVGLGRLRQGFVERSNVQIMHEATKLQVAERQCRALRRALAGLGVFL